MKPTLEVGRLNVRYVPPLEYRETFWFDAFDGDWAVRNKSNGNKSNDNDFSNSKSKSNDFSNSNSKSNRKNSSASANANHC